MSIDPTLEAALGQPVVTLFGALRIAMPARALLLLDGAGQVSFNAGYGTETFLGLDPEFGAIASLEPLSGGGEGEAPELQLSLYPADGVAAAVLAAPDMQGSEVRLFVGALDPATGAVIGAPKLQFLGEIDVPTMDAAQGERVVDYTIISVFERLFQNDDGVRATDGYHQSVWPGELGLSHMTGTIDSLYWGGKPPQMTVASPLTGWAGRYAQVPSAPRPGWSAKG